MPLHARGCARPWDVYERKMTMMRTMLSMSSYDDSTLFIKVNSYSALLYPIPSYIMSYFHLKLQLFLFWAIVSSFSHQAKEFFPLDQIYKNCMFYPLRYYYVILFTLQTFLWFSTSFPSNGDCFLLNPSLSDFTLLFSLQLFPCI